MLQSLSKTALQNLVEFCEADLQIVISETVETLEPTTMSMEACQIVLQMMIQVSEHAQKFGKNERGEKASKQLIRLFELVNGLNKFMGNLNTLKLQNREFYTKMKLAQKEAAALRVKLDDVEKSFKEL